MNKHCFRLIFSKSLGFLIPVAEICSAQRKPGQTSQPSSTVSPSALPPTRWRLKALPLALFGLVPPAFADIVVEPGQQTTMTQSANGVPVVEIAAPNSKGLSHNRFEQFNVSKPGLIFNNSLRDGTSQIGANNHVTHNPNLTREATAILTEVTGNSPSTLAGTLEVFGGKADILIANENAGSASGVNKGRGDTVGSRFRVGLEVVETKETKQDKTYRNAQLNLGSGTMDVGGTFDLGGADINAGFQLTAEQRSAMTAEEQTKASAAMPTLAVSAGDIKSTKFEDAHKQTFSREEVFLGVSHETHSSVADVSNNIHKTAEKASDGMAIDPGLTTLAQLGNASQLAFGETVGMSTTAGLKYTKHSSESQSKSENISQIGGNIGLNSKQGDIILNGVNIKGGQVMLDSAGRIIQRAAKTSGSSSSSTDIINAGATESYSTGVQLANAGRSVGLDGSHDRTYESFTDYTNGSISGNSVNIKAQGDHTMEGATINADQLSYAIGGNQTIISKQDVHDMEHIRANWSASVGVALSQYGLTATASATVGGGKDYDKSKLTKEQSGITADSMNMHISGNQNLTGAHIVNTSGEGSYRVEGQTTATELEDYRDKDGGYGGGGGGMSRNGMPTVVIQAGRVDQVNYDATQRATVDLGGMTMNVGGGVVGALNTDAGKQTEITSDSKVAGTDIKIEISIPNLKNNKKNNKVDPETKETRDQATQTDPEVDVVDGGGSDKLARHMSQATTGNQLKNILAMFNGDSVTKEFLKQNPVELKVRNANGEVVTYPVHDAASLKALHGLNVVTGERAEKNYTGPLDAKLGYSSNLYIKLIPQPSGGFRYVLTPTKPKPLPTANF